MKVKLLKDAHVAINGGVSQSFKEGSVVDIPTQAAEALIKRNEAEKSTDKVTKQEFKK